jgi:hypothetical protein
VFELEAAVEVVIVAVEEAVVEFVVVEGERVIGTLTKKGKEREREKWSLITICSHSMCHTLRRTKLNEIPGRRNGE